MILHVQDKFLPEEEERYFQEYPNIPILHNPFANVNFPMSLMPNPKPNVIIEPRRTHAFVAKTIPTKNTSFSFDQYMGLQGSFLVQSLIWRSYEFDKCFLSLLFKHRQTSNLFLQSIS
jgi:hypothetical protein